MLRDGIRDDQWDRIKDLLPGRIGHVGATARNNRLFIDAVLYRLRTGIPWRDLPERFGDFKNIHRRFSRWAEKLAIHQFSRAAQRGGSGRQDWTIFTVGRGAPGEQEGRVRGPFLGW